MTPVGFFAFLAGALWIGVVSVMLAMRARSASQVPPARSPPLRPLRRSGWVSRSIDERNSTIGGLRPLAPASASAEDPDSHEAGVCIPFAVATARTLNR